MESWAAVAGYFGRYEVSDHGRVRNVQSRRLLSPWRHPRGYTAVTLCDGASKKKRLVHQLVIEAFVGPRPDGLEVCHGNGIKDDNRLENLRYDTPAGNRADIDYQKGEAHSQAKLTASEVLRIRELASIHTQAELARMFGVSPGAINGVVHHRNWAWLGPRPKASARSRKGGDLPPCPYRVFPPKPAPR